MRTIEDGNGQLWDVAVAQGSYGAHFFIFAARGSDDIRKSEMAASTSADAERELAALSEIDLRERLSNSQAWS